MTKTKPSPGTRLMMFLLMIHFPLLQTGQAQNAEKDTLTFQNFLILYPGDQENTGHLLMKLLENHAPRFSGFYEVSLAGKIKIVITGSAKEFQTYGDLHFPTWAGALYIPALKEMVVKSPAWAGSLVDLEHQVLHELSHVYFHEKFSLQKLPVWYNEGLAEYLSNAKIDLEAALKLSNAFAAHNLVAFEEIDSLVMFTSQAKAELAYLQSLSTVLFLKEIVEKKTGWRDFHRLIVEEGWENALQKSAGMDELDLEIAWYADIEKKYRWLVILNIENLLWPVFVIVLFLAFYLIRRRNRKKMRRWEESENSFSDSQ